MSTATIQPHTENISAADAIWALIQTQAKSVQKDLAKRFAALDKKERERRKLKAYEATLTPEQKAWARDVAGSINCALKDVELLEKGQLENPEEVFTSAEDFLAELDRECENA